MIVSGEAHAGGGNVDVEHADEVGVEHAVGILEHAGGGVEHARELVFVRFTLEVRGVLGLRKLVRINLLMELALLDVSLVV